MNDFDRKSELAHIVQATETENEELKERIEELEADAIRSKLVDLYKDVEPHAKRMADYSEKAAALVEEYHVKRLLESFPSAEHVELTPVVSLNARQTPASLDKVLADLKKAEVKVVKVIHDRYNHQFHIFAGRR